MPSVNKLSGVLPNFNLLSIIILCHYFECRCTDCRGAAIWDENFDFRFFPRRVPPATLPPQNRIWHCFRHVRQVWSQSYKPFCFHWCCGKISWSVFEALLILASNPQSRALRDILDDLIKLIWDKLLAYFGSSSLTNQKVIWPCHQMSIL